VRELESSGSGSFEPIQSDQPPHIPTDPTGSSIEYQIDLQSPFGADPDEDVLVSWSQGGEQQRGFRRRNVDTREFPADLTRLKSFWNRNAYAYDSSDTDNRDIEQMNLADELESEVPDRLSIVWYVLSYGIDGTSFAGYYSEPLRLEPAVLELRTP
jgi:hypothetical protein